jgi:hypothetical protein
MWESRRDFQGVWEEWEENFIAFHSFHTPPFPRLVPSVFASTLNIERANTTAKEL